MTLEVNGVIIGYCVHVMDGPGPWPVGHRSSAPPLKVGAHQRSQTMDTEKAIFHLLPRQLSWNLSHWIWLGDLWVLALKKHNKIWIWTSASSSANTRHFYESAFYKKRQLCPLSLRKHLWNFRSNFEGCAMTVTLQVIFGGFLALLDTWALMNERKL